MARCFNMFKQVEVSSHRFRNTPLHLTANPARERYLNTARFLAVLVDSNFICSISYILCFTRYLSKYWNQLFSISLSIHAVFKKVYATDVCGQVDRTVLAATIGFNENELSTVKYWNNDILTDGLGQNYIISRKGYHMTEGFRFDFRVSLLEIFPGPGAAVPLVRKVS